jgi:hypothetical protein
MSLPKSRKMVRMMHEEHNNRKKAMEFESRGEDITRTMHTKILWQK